MNVIGIFVDVCDIEIISIFVYLVEIVENFIFVFECFLLIVFLLLLGWLEVYFECVWLLVFEFDIWVEVFKVWEVVLDWLRIVIELLDCIL